MYITPCILVGTYRRFGRHFCLKLLPFNPENEGTAFVFQYFGDSLSNRTAVFYIVFKISTALRNLTVVRKSVFCF